MSNVTQLHSQANPTRNPGDKLLTVLNGMEYAIDECMLAACMAKAAQYLANPMCHEVEILIKERVPTASPDWKRPGWLEYEMNVSLQDNRVLTIMCIQRNVGRKVEFHS